MDILIRTKSRKPRKIWNLMACFGEIKIGDFKETIYIPVEWWTIADYKRQWKEGLERIRTHSRSCLVATFQCYPNNKILNWWVLYKKKNKIYIRNEMYARPLFEKLIGDKEFTPETCYDFIGRRIIYKKIQVSEWVVDFE